MTMTEFKTWAFPQEVEENCLLPKVLILGSYPCGNITIVSVHAELYVSELSPRFYDWINFSLGIFPCVLVMHVMCLYYLKCLYGRLDFVLRILRSKLRKIPERRKIYNLVVLQSSVLAAKGNPCKIIGQGRKTSLIASNASCTCSIER